jgi:hypothetical protein
MTDDLSNTVPPDFHGEDTRDHTGGPTVERDRQRTHSMQNAHLMSDKALLAAVTAKGFDGPKDDALLVLVRAVNPAANDAFDISPGLRKSFCQTVPRKVSP